MTDTPGWASPGSPEPPRDDVRPAAGPPSGAVGDAAGGPGPYGGAYGSIPHQGQSGGAPGPDQYGAAPGPGGYGGGPGPYGGAPGGPGQYGGWGVPLSPKPGVVPLRPLGVGEILDGAVTTVRRHWRSALGLSLGLAALQQLLSALGQWWAYERPGDVTEIVALLAPVPLDVLIGVVAIGMLTMVVSKAVLGQPVALREAWQAARPRLAALTGLTLLTGLIAAAPFVPGFALLVVGILDDLNDPMLALGLILLLAALPLALWLTIGLSLAAPALVLEQQGVLAAMARSRRLVRGSWWRLFGINVLTRVLMGVASSMILMPFSIAAVAVSGDLVGTADTPMSVALPPLGLLIVAIGGTIVATFTIPLGAAVNVLLYIDQRIRREALDIELARAAGLPEYGSAGWSGQPTPPGV
ncbi:hypothetical protein [Streptomyces sp. NRRL B-24484]|uniref:hypothetical protein n=1 Tax=Streptomyces sp. NRRL B-24484 TaxID=1463833 RepID=UPI0004BE66DE|nr:hypothetical protein [Streptomyces sp. NRRL B-24484]